MSEIVTALAKEYLDRNDPVRHEVKPRSMTKKPQDGSTQGRTTVVSGYVLPLESESGKGSGSGSGSQRCGSRIQTQIDHVMAIFMTERKPLKKLPKKPVKTTV